MSNPTSEPPPRLFLESTWLFGTTVSVFLFGIVIALSVLCWRSLWPRIRSDNADYKKRRFFLCCLILNFVLATVQAALLIDESVKTFVKNRSYPGGPSAYAQQLFSLPLGIVTLLSYWCAVLLMIWRCIVVYRGARLHLVIFILSGLMFVASFIIGILWLVIKSDPERWRSVEFFLPYLSLSLAINIFISLLTALRLLYHRSKISGIPGRVRGEICTSFSTIVVESAAVFSICSLLFLVPFVVHNPLANSFGQILSEAQIVSSLLIIFRVAEGKGWKRHAHSTDPTLTSFLQMRPMQSTQRSASARSTAPSRLNAFDPATTHDKL